MDQFSGKTPSFGISVFAVIFGLLIQAEGGTEDDTRPYQVVRMYPHTNHQLLDVGQLWKNSTELDLDFWQPPKKIGTVVDVMVPPHRTDYVFDYLANKNLTFEVTISDVERLIKLREKKPRHRMNDFNRRLFESSTSSTRFNFRRYASYRKIVSYMKAVTSRYPSIARLLKIGETHEGRPILVLKIGNPIYNMEKKVFWIDGGIHSREWAAPHTAIYFIHKLVTKYDSDPDIKRYVDTLNFYILPMANPDGYEYTRSSTHPNVRLWRKNRSPERCFHDHVNRKRCCRGVDLNRNFDFHWAESGSSSDPCSEVYHGRRVFSEPESRAIRDFLLSDKRRGKVEAFVTMHTYSQIWIHPFGHRENSYPADVGELYELAKKASRALKRVNGKAYKVGSGADTLYPAAGGSDDWAKAKAGIKFVYLLELRPEEQKWDGFILDERELVPTAVETFEGVRVVIEEVIRRNRAATNTREKAFRQQAADDCFDLRYACRKWVRNNPSLCHSVTSFMREQCRYSCRFCT